MDCLGQGVEILRFHYAEKLLSQQCETLCWEMRTRIRWLGDQCVFWVDWCSNTQSNADTSLSTLSFQNPFDSGECGPIWWDLTWVQIMWCMSSIGIIFWSRSMLRHWEPSAFNQLFNDHCLIHLVATLIRNSLSVQTFRIIGPEWEILSAMLRDAGRASINAYISALVLVWGS